MPECTFIHAADLHLGAPFRGLTAAVADSPAQGPSSRTLAHLLTEATFTALERLEALCLAENAAFLLLSGDIYDAHDGILRARFALRDMFEQLRNAGVRVFIAHGNHNPLDDSPNPVPWPDNVTVFGKNPQVECVMKNNVPLALVHGISHADSRVEENLALRLTPYAPDKNDAQNANLPDSLPPAIFQIAVLHCAVGGAGEGHAPYAPCALSDLTKAGFDYWALGHVHQAKTLNETPPVVYAGSMQGLHINEAGPHGCQIVRFGEKGCQISFAPLAPVVWEKILIDCDEDGRDMETLDDITEAILDRLDMVATRENGTMSAAVFCRVILKGHTSLDTTLRKPGSLQTLLERLRYAIAEQSVPEDFGREGIRAFVHLKDIVLQTSPAVDFTELAKREDLLGEVVRLTDAAAADGNTAKAMANNALNDLYGHRRLKRLVAMPEEEQLRQLTDSAKSLLCSLLEED